jgi:hypothetical protein
MEEPQRLPRPVVLPVLGRPGPGREPQLREPQQLPGGLSLVEQPAVLLWVALLVLR